MTPELMHFKQVLARLRAEYNALRKDFGPSRYRISRHRMTLMQCDRLRVVHEQLALFVPLCRALHAYEQPSMADSNGGRRGCWMARYVSARNAIQRVVKQRQHYSNQSIFPDVQDVMLHTFELGVLKPSKTVSAALGHWAADLAAQSVARQGAYQALMKSFTPAQRSWLRGIGGEQGLVVLRLQDLDRAGRG